MKSGKRGCQGNGYVFETVRHDDILRRGWDELVMFGCDGCMNCCPTEIERIAAGLYGPGDRQLVLHTLDDNAIEQAARCIKLARDLQHFGMRCDINPTRSPERCGTVLEAQSEADRFYTGYLREADERVRDRGREALDGPRPNGQVPGMCVGIDYAAAGARDFSAFELPPMHKETPRMVSNPLLAGGDVAPPFTPAAADAPAPFTGVCPTTPVDEGEERPSL